MNRRGFLGVVSGLAAIAVLPKKLLAHGGHAHYAEKIDRVYCYWMDRYPSRHSVPDVYAAKIFVDVDRNRIGVKRLSGDMSCVWELPLDEIRKFVDAPYAFLEKRSTLFCRYESFTERHVNTLRVAIEKSHVSDKISIWFIDENGRRSGRVEVDHKVVDFLLTRTK